MLRQKQEKVFQMHWFDSRLEYVFGCFSFFLLVFDRIHHKNLIGKKTEKVTKKNKVFVIIRNYVSPINFVRLFIHVINCHEEKTFNLNFKHKRADKSLGEGTG